MPEAEINNGALVFKDEPIFVWYEWTGTGTQFNGARRVYISDAKAWWSHEPNPDRRGNAQCVAELRVEIYVALSDNVQTWKLKGAETANETLDNLVVLFAMQHNVSFETERRLVGVPTF